MPPVTKAVVIKTPHLKASLKFFRHTLKLRITERSARHFVISTQGVRLVFVAAVKDFEVELYFADPLQGENSKAASQSKAAPVKHYKDPNGITVIII